MNLIEQIKMNKYIRNKEYERIVTNDSELLRKIFLNTNIPFVDRIIICIRNNYLDVFKEFEYDDIDSQDEKKKDFVRLMYILETNDTTHLDDFFRISILLEEPNPEFDFIHSGMIERIIPQIISLLNEKRFEDNDNDWSNLLKVSEILGFVMDENADVFSRLIISNPKFRNDFLQLARKNKNIFNNVLSQLTKPKLKKEFIDDNRELLKEKLFTSENQILTDMLRNGEFLPCYNLYYSNIDKKDLNLIAYYFMTRDYLDNSHAMEQDRIKHKEMLLSNGIRLSDEEYQLIEELSVKRKCRLLEMIFEDYKTDELIISKIVFLFKKLQIEDFSSFLTLYYNYQDTNIFNEILEKFKDEEVPEDLLDKLHYLAHINGKLKNINNFEINSLQKLDEIDLEVLKTMQIDHAIGQTMLETSPNASKNLISHEYEKEVIVIKPDGEIIVEGTNYHDTALNRIYKKMFPLDEETLSKNTTLADNLDFGGRNGCISVLIEGDNVYVFLPIECSEEEYSSLYDLISSFHEQSQFMLGHYKEIDGKVEICQISQENTNKTVFLDLLDKYDYLSSLERKK